MKTLLLSIVVALLGFNSNIYAQITSNKKKALIVYYSPAKENVNIIAEQIRQVTDADIFELETKNTYPSDPKNYIEQVKMEFESNFKPTLQSQIKDFAKYDIIYLGFTNWSNSIAPAITAFLENYNLEGKTIVPFTTHSADNLGADINEIVKLAPKAMLKKRIDIDQKNIYYAYPEVDRWIREL